jgi:hypothetical protein
MLAALAGVVHDRQRADGDEHNRDEDNDQGALHDDLAPGHSLTEFSSFKNELRVNVWRG